MPRTNQKWRGAPKGVSWQSRSWCFAEKVTLFIFGSKTKWEKRRIPRETRQSRGGETTWLDICCWLREPGALVTRSKDISSLAVERFLTIFRFLWSGFTLGFYRECLMVVGRGSWVQSRGSWVVGTKSWVMGRGSWVVGRGYKVVGRAKTNDEQQSRT